MAFPYPFPGPVAPYNNVPINAQYFKPSAFVISAISLGRSTTVTTTTDMNYVIGQLIRLYIPPSFGCRQLNDSSGYVTSIPSVNEVVVDIDSSQNVDPFVSSSATTKAQIVAVGDINNGYTSSNGPNVVNPSIPGSFTNISPL